MGKLSWAACCLRLSASRCCFFAGLAPLNLPQEAYPRKRYHLTRGLGVVRPAVEEQKHYLGVSGLHILRCQASTPLRMGFSANGCAFFFEGTLSTLLFFMKPNKYHHCLDSPLTHTQIGYDLSHGHRCGKLDESSVFLQMVLKK